MLKLIPFKQVTNNKYLNFVGDVKREDKIFQLRNNLGNTVFTDEKGDFIYSHQLPTYHLTKVAEINKQVGAVDPTKPPTSPVLSPEDQARVIAGEIAYKEALLPANIKVQQAQHEQRMKELGQMLPFLQKSILDARLATETYSPAEIQNRMAKATSALAADRLSMAGMQDAATRLVAATAPRSFGQRA